MKDREWCFTVALTTSDGWTHKRTVFAKTIEEAWSEANIMHMEGDYVGVDVIDHRPDDQRD